MLRWLFGALLALAGLVAIVAVAGYFILKRPDIPYETLAAKYESAASRYIDLPGGVRMHYRDEGNPNGPAIILVHGFSASLHTWEPWVQRLGDEYRVLSLDLPGHGLTRAPAGYQPTMQGYADMVHEFAMSQNLKSFALAGNSMGGNVAWEFALAYPEELNALVLVDSAGWRDSAPGREDKTPLIFKLLRNPIARAILRDLDSSRLTRQALLSAFPLHPEMVDDAMVSRYVELARAPGHRDILVTLTSQARPGATADRLSAIATPTLIEHGSQDNLIPAAHAQLFKNAIPHAELVIYEGVGHVPQEEIPDDSAATLREFLRRTLPPAVAPAQ